MDVIKRDGTKEVYDSDKIIKAVKKAYKACGLPVSKVVLKALKDIPVVGDTIGIEEIQDRVESILMLDNPELAKAFILYRQKHQRIREYAQRKIDFINNYKKSANTADATIDDNSNVANHNIAVLNSEIHKEENQQINYKILENKIKELYPDFRYKNLIKDLNTVCYLHDSSSQIGQPYCVAISMYPFLLNGIKDIGGLSAAPKNIDSFCGMFVNLVFAIASQFKGAVATPGMLLCMDYFLRKEFGEDYHKHLNKVISVTSKEKTIEYQIHQYFQQIVYSLMQPSGGRGNQAVFWNLSLFDKPFFDTMYGDFKFPDGSPAKWDSLNWLQKDFLHWFNQERLKVVLTFPVVSLCLINQNGKFLDKELYEFAAKEYSEGNSFFTYISDSADSLSSCCRLSSKLEKPQFNFTNGQLSEMTGSKNVITLNLNRIIQDWASQFESKVKAEISIYSDLEHGLKAYLLKILDRVYKYQTAYNECLKDLYKSNLLTVYKAGFIDMKKQYLTIGINGLNQAAEFLDMKCNKNEEYRKFCNFIFSTIKEENKKHKTKELMFNTEFTPCESAALKLYNRDEKDGYWVPSDTNLYASYIFKPNDTEISILDKLYLHGRDFCGDMLDGGSAAHLNLDHHLDVEQYKKIISYAAEVGCKYFTFNIPNCECEDCGFIAKQPFDKCPKCGSTKVALWDRVIGYLTKIKNWSSGRQQEQKTRVYHNKI
jgi:ribonucleoside-triphosphate reductase